jgi:hypothetical protein|tara:strand:- start:3346 stop:3468 length:123 start_codon:yes stop_codon:yes gene_type:complete
MNENLKNKSKDQKLYEALRKNLRRRKKQVKKKILNDKEDK